MWSMRPHRSGSGPASSGLLSPSACASRAKIHHSSRRSPRGATTALGALDPRLVLQAEPGDVDVGALEHVGRRAAASARTRRSRSGRGRCRRAARARENASRRRASPPIESSGFPATTKSARTGFSASRIASRDQVARAASRVRSRPNSVSVKTRAKSRRPGLRRLVEADRQDVPAAPVEVARSRTRACAGASTRACPGGPCSRRSTCAPRRRGAAAISRASARTRLGRDAGHARRALGRVARARTRAARRRARRARAASPRRARRAGRARRAAPP